VIRDRNAFADERCQILGTKRPASALDRPDAAGRDEDVVDAAGHDVDEAVFPEDARGI
jgi:hypothetical protein